MLSRFVLRPILLLVVLSGFLCSCRDHYSDLINETADRIEGTYDLEAIAWEGEPVDLNNDGIASKDLLQELLSLPTNAENNHQAVVTSITLDRSIGAIGMDLPMQNVSIAPNGQYPEGWMIGNMLTVSISYHIDSSGSLLVDHFDSVGLPDDDSRIEIKRMKNGTVSFDYKGHMSFKVGYALYDRQSKQLVDGIIQYLFERIES